MIEKIMKAVKRNSKRRSVNITIGAVVGFLLSCTTIAGAETTALEITGDGRNFNIGTAIEGNTFEGNVYTNNGEISGESSNGTIAEGIKISGTSNDGTLSVVNKGVVNAENTGTGGSAGITLYSGTAVTGTIKNDGTVNSTSVANVSYGIVSDGSITGNIENNGVTNSASSQNASNGILLRNNGSIKGNIENDGTVNSTSNGDVGVSYGIVSDGSITGNIENNGVTNSASSRDNSYGILLNNTGSIKGNIENIGVINTTAAKVGYGIHTAGAITEAITNDGIINIATVKKTSYGIFINTEKAKVKAIKNDGIIKSTSEEYSNYGIDIESTVSLSGNITNNGVINGSAGSANSSYGILLKNKGKLTGDIENTGAISNTSENYSYGIGSSGEITGSMKNKGLLVSKTSSRKNYGVGMSSSNAISGDIENRGYIKVNGTVNSLGIENSAKAGTILNYGNINAKVTDAATDVAGIGVGSKASVANVDNRGLIKSEKTGVSITNNANITGNIKNSGIIYGKEHAILSSTSGEIKGTKTNNGLLIVDGNNREQVLSNILLTNNYGLAFSVGTDANDGKYFLMATEAYSGGGERIIKNAVLNQEADFEATGRINGTESIDLSNLEYDPSDPSTTKGHILNGIDKTLEINAANKTLNDSIVNAYKTAVVMKGDKTFTATGSVFNGGADGKAKTISLTGENNTLNITAKSIVNGDMEITGESNTLNINAGIMNGDISAAGNNNLTIENSYANGKITAGAGNILTIKGSNLNDELITGDTNNLTIENSYLNGKITAGAGNTLDITGSNLNDEMTITGNGSTLAMDKSYMNGKLAANGNSNNLTITDSNLNKDIAIDGNNNTLNISGEKTYINGDMEAEGSGNTVKLGGKAGDNSLNIFNNISGFDNMNIADGNVTFFENAEVTGTTKVTVEQDGILNLRLKNSGSTVNGLTEATHAFSGNGPMTMEGLNKGGTLKFITNGIGKGALVDTSNIHIQNMTIETNSVLDGFKFGEDGKLVLKPYETLAGMSQSGTKVENSKEPSGDGSDMFDSENFNSIDGVYKGIHSSTGENLNALREIGKIDRNTGKFNEGMDNSEQQKNLQAYLNEVYTQSPYALSSELSRRSAGMFRDIVTENMFRPNLNKWMIMGGLTHIDGGTKDTYYGEVYKLDGNNSLNTDADIKMTGAYALGKYGYSENTSLGVAVGGNRSEAELAKSKVKGNSGYIGAFAENYRGNLTLKAGAGIQYSEYDADRSTVGGHSYSDKYSDMTYDIYLNGRYSNALGNNLFLEPYAALSYTYIDQEGTDEGSKALAIETDSKSFDYTSAKVGVDLKKVIPHEIGKSTLSAGVSYTRLLNGADSDNLTGRFNGGSDFDILVASKNEHSLGVNAKYTLELESGILFDVKGNYSFERDSHKNNARNRSKGEWMAGAGIGYKF